MPKIARNQPNQDCQDVQIGYFFIKITENPTPATTNPRPTSKLAACVKQVKHLKPKNLINMSLCLCAEIQGKISTHLQCYNILSSSPKWNNHFELEAPRIGNKKYDTDHPTGKKVKYVFIFLIPLYLMEMSKISNFC
ncbi:hypothetical protein VP01_2209g1 [Puccinia sorghi]|uniref:Uncharacterized protein n=1 Tax=Puccinia sorghi TaxID=27349 RepID=A0A0L6V8S5_9BASI|nr:hypothetical protein VP01_2209g1 [Puccinia sorghi]